MKKNHSHLDTTRVELTATETMLDTPLDAESQQPPGMGSRQLQAHFDAILRDGAIFYPTAYRFKRELGRGRQGVVFLGLRQGSRGCVTRHAIKLFDPGIYSSAKKYWTDMGRISAQVSELHSVHSPQLVSRDIYEETNGIGYIQMEAVQGLDVRRFLEGDHLELVRSRASKEQWARYTDSIFRFDGGTLSVQPGIAVHIIRQVLRGLEVLHRHGFIHSDIKPGNIMIDGFGYVKLIDFGRAVKANEEMRILLGSPMYMAPETHRRQPSTPQTDLFSAGLVGIELLRGQPLVTDTTGLTEKDLLDIKLKLRDQLPDLLPDHVRQNHDLVEMLQRLVSPEPQDRFPSAQEAESGDRGLRLVHKQLTHLNKDTAYERELENYLTAMASASPPDA